MVVSHFRIKSFEDKESWSCSKSQAMSYDEWPSIFFLDECVIDLSPLFALFVHYSHVVVVVLTPEENCSFKNVGEILLRFWLQIKHFIQLKMIWNQVHEGKYRLSSLIFPKEINTYDSWTPSAFNSSLLPSHCFSFTSCKVFNFTWKDIS